MNPTLDHPRPHETLRCDAPARDAPSQDAPPDAAADATPPESAAPCPPPLDYSPTGRRSRRRWRIAGLLLLLAALIATARHHYPRVSQHLALRACVHDCLAWRPPAGLPLYDDDPAAPQRLAAPRGTYTRGMTGLELRVPPMERLDARLKLGLPFDFWPPIFTQTLEVAGRRRLVSLRITGTSSTPDQTTKEFDGVVIDPGRWYESPKVVKPAIGPVDPDVPLDDQPRARTIRLAVPLHGGHLRIDPGAPDPDDASSALYPYTFGGQPGQIRLRLLPDESIDLRPESGPLKALTRTTPPASRGSSSD